MRDELNEPDLVIVGGGIAGGSLATVMARAGTSVLVLERQSEYRDRVRGEILWPWGVRLARVLEIERPLLEAGALIVTWLDLYDEAAESPAREDVSAAILGIDGSLNITHPKACGALANAARSVGADVRMGVQNVRVSPGRTPLIEWLDESGSRHETRCKLIVGADGRSSSVRAQARIHLEVDEPAHLVAGMLVQAEQGMADDVNVQAREADLLFFSFPEGDGLARLYLCFPSDDRSRFAGPAGPQRFLSACDLTCLKGVSGADRAQPAGPCATFTAEDSRTSHPLADGVVLIGDAAGYENPLQGQGLSMALQDVYDVSEALLSEQAPSGLESYARKRAVRQRLANLGVALEIWVNDGFAVQDPVLRTARYEYVRGDDVLAALEADFITGFDNVPQDLTHAELTRRLSAFQP